MADGTLLLANGVPGVDPLSHRGNGSPEAVVVAPVGSRYQQLDGTPGATFYVKESGSGATGWAAYGAPGAGAPTTQVEVDFGTDPVMSKTFTFANAGAITSQRVIATQAYAAATGKTADENEWDALIVAGGVLVNGTVTLAVTALPGPVVGAFKLNYQLA